MEDASDVLAIRRDSGSGIDVWRVVGCGVGGRGGRVWEPQNKNFAPKRDYGRLTGEMRAPVTLRDSMCIAGAEVRTVMVVWKGRREDDEVDVWKIKDKNGYLEDNRQLTG